MSNDLTLSLIENIYDAATGDTPWAAVGMGLKRLVDAGSASLMAGHFTNGDAELLYRGDFPLEAIEAYQRHYRSVDLWTNRVAAAIARQPGEALRARVSGTLVPDREFVNSEFYTDFGRGLGLRHVVGAVIPLGAAGVMPIGLHRPEGSAPFERAHAQLLEQVLPHLRRAMQLRHRLAAGGAPASPALPALDALAVGVIVVDAEARVLVANAAAEAMAAGGGAIRFARAGAGTAVTGLRQAETAALASIVRATATGGGAGGAVALRDADGEVAVAALVSPLPRRLAASGAQLAGRVRGQALILLRSLRPAESDLDLAMLRQVFGLTLAEAEVALALAGGATRQAVATRRGAKASTVQSQVRAILAKTGAANLRDFERILAGLKGA